MASLDAEDELLARCETIASERDRVRAELIEAGYEVPDTQANFVWLPLGEAALDFAEHTLANKVVVRAFASGGVRVTISHHDENDLFLHAARSYRSNS
jgi:histidinol-phosphate aminotransferase